MPPTQGYEYLPSGTIEEAGFGVLPEWARRNGTRPKKTKIELGPELPPGKAHNEMLRIVGKLARSLSPEELLRTAGALNGGRLPDHELTDMIEAISAKEQLEESQNDQKAIHLLRTGAKDESNLSSERAGRKNALALSLEEV